MLKKAFDGEVYYWYETDRQGASAIRVATNKKGVATMTTGKVSERDEAFARVTIAQHSSTGFLGFLGKEPLEELVSLFANALTTARKEEREEVWRNAAQKVHDKAGEWRKQAERWQKNAESAGMDIIREQDYIDRDACLCKMSAAMTLAIEFDKVVAANGGGGGMMAMRSLERRCPRCRNRGPHTILGTQPGKSHPVVISSSPYSTYTRGTAIDNPYKIVRCANCEKTFKARATGMEMLFR